MPAINCIYDDCNCPPGITWGVTHAGRPFHAPRDIRVEILTTAHAISGCGIWRVDDDIIVKEVNPLFTPGELPVPSNEGRFQELANRYLSHNSPVPVVIHQWETDDGSGKAVIVMERVRGVSLYKRWHSLTQNARIRIAQQVGDWARKWRESITQSRCKLAPLTLRPRLEVQKRPPILNLSTMEFKKPPALPRLSPSLPMKPYTTDDEAWEQIFLPPLAKMLELYPPDSVRKVGVTEGLINFLRDTMPNCSNKVFTHNDLWVENILVEDEEDNPDSPNLVGIIDWEYAGFCPAWFEAASTFVDGTGNTLVT